MLVGVGAVLAAGGTLLALRPRAVAPRSLADLLRAGHEATRRGDLEDACARFAQACAAAPDVAVARFCLGVSLAGLGRWEASRVALAEAHALDPADGAARYHLARALARLGRAREAVPLLAPLVAAHPEAARALAQDDAFVGARDDPRFLLAVGI